MKAPRVHGGNAVSDRISCNVGGGTYVEDDVESNARLTGREVDIVESLPSFGCGGGRRGSSGWVGYYVAEPRNTAKFSF